MKKLSPLSSGSLRCRAMTLRLVLVGALLLQVGCVSHYKSATYVNINEGRALIGSRRIAVALVPTVRLSRHGTFPERMSYALFAHDLATGPYSVLVLVKTDAIENGVPVEVTSVELHFASGEMQTILSRHEPGRKSTTQQRPRQSKYVPAETFSRCDFVFPLGDRLIFKADEPVRVVATVRIDGQPEDVTVAAEFKGRYEEHWGSTLSTGI